MLTKVSRSHRKNNQKNLLTLSVLWKETIICFYLSKALSASWYHSVHWPCYQKAYTDFLFLLTTEIAKNPLFFSEAATLCGSLSSKPPHSWSVCSQSILQTFLDIQQNWYWGYLPTSFPLHVTCLHCRESDNIALWSPQRIDTFNGTVGCTEPFQLSAVLLLAEWWAMGDSFSSWWELL